MSDFRIKRRTIDANLRAEEIPLRSDMAVGQGLSTYLTGGKGVTGCFRLTLTTQRLLFLPPKGEGYLELWLSSLIPAFIFIFQKYVPQPGAYAIELHQIKRLWKWQPEFSGMPMIQLGDDRSIYFQLLAGEFPKLTPASIDAQREHFEAIESAWLAIRDDQMHAQEPS